MRNLIWTNGMVMSIDRVVWAGRRQFRGRLPVLQVLEKVVLDLSLEGEGKESSSLTEARP